MRTMIILAIQAIKVQVIERDPKIDDTLFAFFEIGFFSPNIIFKSMVCLSGAMLRTQ